MKRLAKSAAGLGLALGLQAHALIVVDGKVVTAWPETARAKTAAIASAAADSPPFLGQYPHPKGTFYGLTLLIDFPDQAPAFNKEQVEAWLNQKGFNQQGLKGSVRDYYADISNGQFDFINEVHGIYRAKQTKAYYDGGNGYERASEFVKEVLDALDGEVDFSKFDNDKDGVTESISLVYAGKGKTWGQGLWPHAGGINQKRDGVTLSRYMMTDMGDRYALYVFCHECGHMIFGWPDLYGVGDYCLMANRMNDVNPVPVNDLYRADQGWIPVIDIQAADNFRYTTTLTSGGFRFLNPNNSKECFFWSNIKNTGRWSSLKGKGLLVWHFDKSIGSNTPPKTLSLAVVQADGKRDLDTAQWPSPGSDAKDFFYQGNATEFSASTLPKPLWNNGQAAALRLHSIGPAADTMTFAVGTGTPVGLNARPAPSGQVPPQAPSRGLVRRRSANLKPNLQVNPQQYLGRDLKP